MYQSIKRTKITLANFYHTVLWAEYHTHTGRPCVRTSTVCGTLWLKNLKSVYRIWDVEYTKEPCGYRVLSTGYRCRTFRIWRLLSARNIGWNSRFVNHLRAEPYCLQLEFVSCRTGTDLDITIKQTLLSRKKAYGVSLWPRSNAKAKLFSRCCLSQLTFVSRKWGLQHHFTPEGFFPKNFTNRFLLL